MSKLKIIGIVALFLLLATLTVTINILTKQIKVLKDTSGRLETNQEALLKNSKDYLIKADLSEFKNILTPRIDSIIKELKVKPKNVERIIERYYTHTDSIIKEYAPKPIDVDGQRLWPFIDTVNCFTFGGNLKLIDKQPAIEVNRREFENNSTDIYYRERSKKFLFIRYGEWLYSRHSESDCGTSETKEIVVEKK